MGRIIKSLYQIINRPYSTNKKTPGQRLDHPGGKEVNTILTRVQIALTIIILSFWLKNQPIKNSRWVKTTAMKLIPADIQFHFRFDMDIVISKNRSRAISDPA